MSKKEKIFVAGSAGMVGSAIVRQLEKYKTYDILAMSRTELDLTNQHDVRSYFKNHNIDQVYLAAAKVGGIYANNNFPAEFIYQNLMIETNVIHEAWRAGIAKLLFLGSSCIYPKHANQPMKEDSLLTGSLEPTNEPYSIAKIAGIKLCESYNRQYDEVDYRSVMPTNLFGPGDNYHSVNSHVIPGLIRRFHEAKVNSLPQVKVWGSGLPRREFLYVDDMASASLHVMNLSKDEYRKIVVERQSHINVGYGSDFTIKEVASIISSIVGYEGDILFDKTKPDGPQQKLLDCTKLKESGWSYAIDFKEGLELAYADFLKNINNLRSI